MYLECGMNLEVPISFSLPGEMDEGICVLALVRFMVCVLLLVSLSREFLKSTRQLTAYKLLIIY